MKMSFKIIAGSFALILAAGAVLLFVFGKNTQAILVLVLALVGLVLTVVRNL